MKGIRRTLLKGLLIIGFIGTTLSFIIPIILMLIKPEIGDEYVFFVLGLPFTIFAWPYGLYKSVKDGENKHGRLWGAIKHAPKWMIILLWILILAIFIVFIIDQELVFMGIIPLFNYIALLIYLSGILHNSIEVSK